MAKNKSDSREEQKETLSGLGDIRPDAPRAVNAAFNTPVQAAADGEELSEYEKEMLKPNPKLETDPSPVNDLIHDDQGNVREVFTNAGVGSVTPEQAEDVLQRIREEGLYVLVERTVEANGDVVYDVYREGKLIIVGAREQDLKPLIK